MGGKFSREKGKRGELKVVHLMNRWFPDAQRGIQSRKPSPPDVDNTPYWIEVKYYDTISPTTIARAYNSAVAAMEKFIAKNSSGWRPVVVLCKSTSDRKIGWEVLTSYEVLKSIGYTGSNHKFQHPILVNRRTDLRLVKWDVFRDLMDAKFPHEYIANNKGVSDGISQQDNLDGSAGERPRETGDTQRQVGDDIQHSNRRGVRRKQAGRVAQNRSVGQAGRGHKRLPEKGVKGVRRGSARQS